MNIKPSLESILHVFFINMSMQNDITSNAFTILCHFKDFIVTLTNKFDALDHVFSALLIQAKFVW